MGVSLYRVVANAKSKLGSTHHGARKQASPRSRHEERPQSGQVLYGTMEIGLRKSQAQPLSAWGGLPIFAYLILAAPASRILFGI